MRDKSLQGKLVDTEAVRRFNEAQIWTAYTKDGKVIHGSLATLRKYEDPIKHKPAVNDTDADKQLG